MKTVSRAFYIIAVLIFVVSCNSTKNITDEISHSANSFTINSFKPAAETPTETWHLTPALNESYTGTGVEQAYQELLSGKSPRQKVIVAIIDSGTDIEHEDLSDKIWINDDEIPGNNIDDDGNGYVDDLNGWNFIGGADGENVDKDTYEVTRLYAEMRDEFKEKDPSEIPSDKMDEYQYFLDIKEAYQTRVNRNQQELQQITQIRMAVQFAKNTLGIDSIDDIPEDSLQLTGNEDQQTLQSKQIISSLKANGATEKDIEDLDEYNQQLNDLSEYGLNPDFDPRYIVGDDYDDLSNRYYGNNDVKGPRSDHGTHVAGIVGAIRNNNIGAQGIADYIELMIVRTVPDGDERDKDVANAIRYATENGAKVINMSFGKGYSPQKEYVDAAIKFADEQGVLLVSGAGNGSENIDETDSFPSRFYEDGNQAINFLSVGATSWKTDSTLVASFSNYGKNTVDVFAPGVDVYSTYPGDEYEKNSGTSMAAPVVSGIAALMMSYYPDLSTTQIKDILLKTVTKINLSVYKPGDMSAVSFSELSSTGGIINAYNAIRTAEELSR
ncbi:S8 family peptidase [Gracilimonas sp. Q87]|uniref:S8 family peptidase n=1 Tax=Gracilimonas sp. Q87 TaxID=3384766 RepID=UPI0039841E1C